MNSDLDRGVSPPSNSSLAVLERLEGDAMMVGRTVAERSDEDAVIACGVRMLKEDVFFCSLSCSERVRRTKELIDGSGGRLVIEGAVNDEAEGAAEDEVEGVDDERLDAAGVGHENAEFNVASGDAEGRPERVCANVT